MHLELDKRLESSCCGFNQWSILDLVPAYEIYVSQTLLTEWKYVNLDLHLYGVNREHTFQSSFIARLFSFTHHLFIFTHRHTHQGITY